MQLELLDNAINCFKHIVTYGLSKHIFPLENALVFLYMEG